MMSRHRSPRRYNRGVKRPQHRARVETLEQRVLLCVDCPDHADTIAIDDPNFTGNAIEPAAGALLLPDLISWADQANGYIYGWEIDTTQIPGRTLLRLTTASANIGAGPVELRGGPEDPEAGTQQVFQRIYDDQGGFTDTLAGNFIYHAAHDHVHFDDYSDYNLRRVTAGDGVGETIAQGDKVSFCLLDVDAYDTSLPGAPANGVYEECDELVQGISVGWADVYHKSLADQWIDITGVKSGTYWLEVVVDPSNRLIESNESNNVARIKITLNTGGSIAGTVFNDPNSNGVRNAGEAPLAGWTVYIDGNNNGSLDANEISTTTDDSGDYFFGSMPAGTHRVRQASPAGYRKTLPGSGTPGYNVAIAGGSNVTGRDFGNTTNLLLAGVVYNDANGNGSKGPGENGLPGATVQIISNNTVVATRITDANGVWQVKGLSAGAGEARVSLNGYAPTNPADGRIAGSMSSGQQNANLNFGLRLASSAPPPAMMSILRPDTHERRDEEPPPLV